MKRNRQNPAKTIINRELLMQLKTCPACGQPFNLGDPVVMACGAWEGPATLVHENEAVWDENTGQYMERKCYEAQRI